MKQIKAQTLLISITMLFFVFCLGYYLGNRERGDTVTILRTRDTATQQEELTGASIAASARTLPEVEKTGESHWTAEGRLKINQATAEELQELPGIGEVLARRILTYRQENGEFSSIDELCAVPGIGEKRLEAIRDYITLEENDEDSGS